MRISAALIVFGLLEAGCGSRDKANHQFVGKWQHEGGFNSTIFADGSFSSSYTGTNQSIVLAYQGTWQAKDGELDFTITNVSGTRLHEPVGTIDRMKIVAVDGSRLVLEHSGQTYYYQRK